MASVKIWVFPSKSKKKDVKVQTYLRLIHETVIMYIPLEIRVNQDHFDFTKMECKKSHDQYLTKNAQLKEKLITAERIVDLDLSKQYYTPEALRDYIAKQITFEAGEATLQGIADIVIKENIEMRSRKNAKAYAGAVHAFIKWNGKDLPLTALTTDLLKSFKIHLNQKNKVGGAYFRALRALYKRAISDGLVDIKNYPFKKGIVPAPNKRGKPNEFTLDTIRKIREHRLTFPEGCEQRAANYMILQYFLQGIDYVDLTRLRKAHIEKGYLKFQRYKNRRFPDSPMVYIKITPEIQEILDEYKESDLLIPILEDFPIWEDGYVDLESEEFEKARDTRENNLRRDIKKVCQIIDEKLTNKSMRYVYTKVGRQVADFSVTVMEALQGHESDQVSFLYSPYSQQQLDDANRKMIDLSTPGAVIPLYKTA